MKSNFLNDDATPERVYRGANAREVISGLASPRQDRRYRVVNNDIISVQRRLTTAEIITGITDNVMTALSDINVEVDSDLLRKAIYLRLIGSRFVRPFVLSDEPERDGPSHIVVIKDESDGHI